MELTICSLSDKILIYVFNQSTYYCQTELSGKSWCWLTNYVNKLKVRTNANFHSSHCLKSVRFRSFSGQYFPAFGLNTERYFISLCIQSGCGKIQTRKIPNTDTFYAVSMVKLLPTVIKNAVSASCFFPNFAGNIFFFQCL